jgi:hypothetical protein
MFYTKIPFTIILYHAGSIFFVFATITLPSNLIKNRAAHFEQPRFIS